MENTINLLMLPWAFELPSFEAHSGHLDLEKSRYASAFFLMFQAAPSILSMTKTVVIFPVPESVLAHRLRER